METHHVENLSADKQALLAQRLSRAAPTTPPLAAPKPAPPAAARSRSSSESASARPGMVVPEADPGLRLGPAAVHLWRAPLDLDSETRRRLREPLTPDETERAQRFAFDRDRDRWVAARGWLRHLLGAYLDLDPAELRLHASESGKPELAGVDHWLRFNVSHSADLAVFAVARDREVGVDVERIDGHDPVPRRFLTDAEQAALARIAPAERPGAALRCWTAREAYVKALGSGLRGTAQELVTAATLLGKPDEGRDSTAWTLHAFDAGPGYVATIVVQGTGADVPVAARPVSVRPPEPSLRARFRADDARRRRSGPLRVRCA